VPSRLRLAFLVLASHLISAAADGTPSPDWPRWRGPRADSVADGRRLPLHWDHASGRNVRWSTPLPGWGTSSPVVLGPRVFVTTQHEADGRRQLLTLCLDRATGRELWRHDGGPGVDQRTHKKSNLAVNTPTATADALYVAFGNAEIARYTHEGRQLWVTRYLEKFPNPKMAWGYSPSPVVLDDAVVFAWDHHTGPCFLIGLDPRSGAIAWQEPRPIGTAHSTPLVVDHHGQRDLLVSGKNRLTAFDARTHRELWQYGRGEGPFNGEIIVSPVHADGVVYLQLWRQSPVHAIRLRGGGQPPEPLWVSEKPGGVEPSPLHYRGHLYLLLDQGVLVCLDARDGRELYRERLGGECNSSPVASDGRIYASDITGRTFVVRAGPTFALLATNALDGRITASPAISGDDLIYRTDSRVYCLGGDGRP
jgi:outer membrane protein assembly factor BamB